MQIVKYLDFFSEAWAGNKFIRFIFVGVLNTIFGYGCFALLIYIGLHYSLALLISTVLGILFNFKSTGVIVFKIRNNALILRFFMVYLFCYLVNLLGLRQFVEAGWDPISAGILLTVPVALLSFYLMKKYVFQASR